MTMEAHSKVTASHLKRDAYLYVRQSTVRQVFENQHGFRAELSERAARAAAQPYFPILCAVGSVCSTSANTHYVMRIHRPPPPSVVLAGPHLILGV
jgi:hypothetical protein